MSIISNITIPQNPQTKKTFSKISFDAGETFNARIISVDLQKGEVNLKLLDGWQFTAKLDKPLEQNADGTMLKFQVEGFENDKLKIKLIYEDKENKTAPNEGIEVFSKGKSLSTEKTDFLLFEKMIKHDMPLTKGNIIDIKNLVDFREKISLDSNKEEIFIARYLDSRNIDHNSEKGNEITKILKSFFEALKKLDVDEILLFKENNIELTKENLESFIKLFKGQSAVYNNLKEINSYLLSSDKLANLNPINIKSEVFNQEDTFANLEFTNNNIEKKSEKISNSVGQIMNKTQISDKFILNSNLKEVVNLINSELKNLDVNYRVLNSTIKSLNLDFDLNKNINIIKNVEDINTEIDKAKNIDINKEIDINKNINTGKNLQLDKNLKLGNFNINSDTIKLLVDKIFKSNEINLSPDIYGNLIDNLKEKINSAPFDAMSINLENIVQDEELPLNILQKDKNKDVNINNEVDIINKNASNTKTHGYSKNNSLNEIISMIKKELNISEVGKGIIINDSKEIEKITTDFLIKEQIKLKTDEIKNIVKDLIENKLNLKPETYDKVMNLFYEKVNDLKIFNSISEQYYYLDLPLSIKDDEYQFKLIIKDDRKKGKKIDSKNIKIATSVKTINMGTVDAYIKINNNNMNIDINCDEFWVKVLKLGKEKLIKDLSNLNYRVNIDVNNMEKQFTLANCGDFFDDRSFNNINIKV